ncbi:Peptidase C1A papain C-terminal domain-containing protein [Caenorhabditis elegans]|uniref:Peptidase C1A papain C-terminal domain-containing protein n=3 Tax=Caenorhabditis elegans TaxID=6239 RepID=U4PME4_CAEEL|nr:Peptidase C1A papain C-terminal domain-containing protein [Caenorhabditis elegans]CDH93256.1 Peptidase C1A papain C-terminal domain-containing protein [Caenorhabditis elegans]|eukprot:NP_001293573.1 Uncharacterized protein CELE_C32B5.7 [Caenorhabditis elegans]
MTKKTTIEKFPEKPANLRNTRNYIGLFLLTALTFYIIGALVQQRTQNYKNAKKPFLDWRDEGVVGPVKDQGNCNASYAFAAISAIESMYAIANGQLLSFSEQQIIDCLGGCAIESDPMMAMTYLERKGIETYTDYPFVGKKNEKCEYDSKKAYLILDDTYDMSDESLALVFIDERGPGLFTMNTPPSFFNYKSGIYNPTEEECKSTNEKRALTIVGYGNDKGQNYWIVKGSFGT